jgi:hypothetical protein
MHASLQKSTVLTSGRFSKASTMQRRCGMVWGRAILAATTNKKMNAHARTMAPAKQSTAATFRNIQRPYHGTGENRRIVNKNHKRPECSNGYRQKNLGNCLHSVPNSRQHLALRSCAHLVAHGEAHIGSNSRAHILSTIRGHLGDTNTGQTSGQLATFKGATSRLHLGGQIRPPDYLARDARNLAREAI